MGSVFRLLEMEDSDAHRRPATTDPIRAGEPHGAIPHGVYTPMAPRLLDAEYGVGGSLQSISQPGTDMTLAGINVDRRQLEICRTLKARPYRWMPAACHRKHGPSHGLTSPDEPHEYRQKPDGSSC